MEFEKIKTAVTAISALVTTGKIFMNWDFSAKLSEDDVEDFLQPLYNDLLKVRNQLSQCEINNINLNIRKYTDDLKVPKFLKDNEKNLREMQNHIDKVTEIYNSIRNTCIGVLNEELRISNLNCSFKIKELNDIPEELAECLFKYRNDEKINELHKEMVDLFEKQVDKNGLSGIETINLNKRVNEASINIINKISRVEKNNESPILEFIEKYFNEEKNKNNLTEYEIILQGYVRQFYDYANFVYKEINEVIKEISAYYEKHKPKK